MKLSQFIVIFVIFVVCESKNMRTFIDDYIKVVLCYCRERNVHILTHFTCFSLNNNVKVAFELSKENIQSRFIEDFTVQSYLIDTPKNTIQGFVVNRMCELDMRFFLQEDHGIIFKDNHKWLFIDNNLSSTISESIIEYKHDFNVFDALPISDVVIAKRLQVEPDQWQLFDVYKINFGYDIEISENGKIKTIDDDLKVVGTTFSARRRQNLKGAVLKCGLVIAYPEQFTYFDDPANDHIDVFTKASIPLSRNIQDTLNISCLIYQTDSYIDGLKALYVKKKVQMTMHSVGMQRAYRLEFAEYAGDIPAFRTPLIFRQPPLSSVANIFLLPLEMDVWICVFIVIIVVFIIMLFQLRHPILAKLAISTTDVATFIWGAICQQGTHLNIPTTPGRIVFLTIFLTSLALFTSYSATIVALLQSPSNSIKNVNDLLASPLKAGFHDAQYIKIALMNNVSDVTELYTKKVLPQGDQGWIRDAFKGVERVRTELFAFQVESPSAYKAIRRTFTEEEKCSLSELQMINLPLNTILVERNSGHKELIKQIMRWQTETGLLKREENRWTPKKPVCEGGQHGFTTVGLQEIRPAVHFLLIGYAFSVTIFLLEHFYPKMKQIFKKMKDRTSNQTKCKWTETD